MRIAIVVPDTEPWLCPMCGIEGFDSGHWGKRHYDCGTITNKSRTKVLSQSQLCAKRAAEAALRELQEGREG